MNPPIEPGMPEPIRQFRETVERIASPHAERSTYRTHGIALERIARAVTSEQRINAEHRMRFARVVLDYWCDQYAKHGDSAAKQAMVRANATLGEASELSRKLNIPGAMVPE
jgi:hypothetical protein